MESPIILFDGVCNFCNYWVNLIIKYDRKKVFKFAPLQGIFGSSIHSKLLESNLNVDSVVLSYNGSLYTQSDAVINIGSLLGGIFVLLKIGLLLPKPVRNKMYNWIAQNRYRWFGKKETCMIPSAEIAERFLL